MAYRIDDVFSALADQNRREILLMLTDKKMTVNSIAENFNISRPAISKHLKVLLKTNLVVTSQKGRERYYQLNVEPMNEVRDWLKLYDKFWDTKLKSLKNYLEEE
ncbi:MAG: metalloregulator ArsR/SmtB family transcription factor [Ignavibacteria bacterium]|nr:metalloregulator ArsR/SmtB family transcription factor [Ignavibacteria bacterium]